MTLTEGMHEGEFIGELAMGLGFHVDAITLTSGQDLVAGAVLGKVETGTPTATVGTPVSGSGGTVGDGALGAWTADAAAMEGTWRIVFTDDGTNVGTYEVIKPDGTLDGVGTVAVAYNGGINGTIADGSNDWVIDDYIPIVVAYSGTQTAPKYVEHNPTATNGSQVACGILMKATDATGGDTITTALVRGPAVVNGNDLTWKSGATTAQKTKGKAQLQAIGIKVSA